MTPLFDTYVIVDWSARSSPSPVKPSKDAIWIGIARAGVKTVETRYIRTRFEAEAALSTIAREETAAGRRALLGFDFPFGYPAGVAERVTGRAEARAMWRWLADAVKDARDNANNRYDVAASVNRLYAGDGPFWGTPNAKPLIDVPTHGKSRHGDDHPAERRACEAIASGAKTVWQLAGAGAVGSQVLMGLPMLERLRRAFAEDAEVWPFDTGLAAPSAPLVFAEIYPSLFAVPSEAKAGEIGDELQVRATAAAYRDFDAAGDLAAMFEGPGLAPATARAVATEEAWILGLGHPALDVRPRRGRSSGAPTRLSYERDPAAIYDASFAAVRAEARLDHLPDDLRDVAIRLVHSCGMTDIPNRLAWSGDVAARARDALAAGAPVLCDCEMVAAGVIRRFLPTSAEVVTTLNDSSVPERAKTIANTRSAAAVELWADRLAGAVVLIGNAPTALFRLLEMLDDGAPKPAAILAFPVGFVGAAESKAELARDPRGAAFLTLRGRRGGSAMASAALNALAGGLG